MTGPFTAGESETHQWGQRLDPAVLGREPMKSRFKAKKSHWHYCLEQVLNTSRRVSDQEASTCGKIYGIEHGMCYGVEV